MKRPDKKACEMSVKELAAYIDYSVLKPEFTEQEIIQKGRQKSLYFSVIMV